MTYPDDRLEFLLRQGLHEATAGIQPGPAGLDAIRRGIGGRPPRPWLLSVLAGWAERVRYWTWRGHWAWPQALSRPGSTDRAAHPSRSTSGPAAGRGVSAHARHSSGAGWGWDGWLRPAAVFGGVVVIIGVAFGLQPVRQAIVQASSAVINTATGAHAGAGTDGNGAAAGGPNAQPGGTGGSGGGGSSGGSGGPSASSSGTASAGSLPGALPGVSPGATLGGGCEPADGASPQASATSAATPAATASGQDCAVPSPTSADDGGTWTTAPAGNGYGGTGYGGTGNLPSPSPSGTPATTPSAAPVWSQPPKPPPGGGPGRPGGPGGPGGPGRPGQPGPTPTTSGGGGTPTPPPDTGTPTPTTSVPTPTTSAPTGSGSPAPTDSAPAGGGGDTGTS